MKAYLHTSILYLLAIRVYPWRRIIYLSFPLRRQNDDVFLLRVSFNFAHNWKYLRCTWRKISERLYLLPIFQSYFFSYQLVVLKFNKMKNE